MPKYVDVEKAHVEHIYCFYGSACHLADVQEWIDELPEEKVKKITYGHWIPHDTMIRTPYARNYDCSVCGNSPIECGDYCNKCGSYMKGL